MAYPKRKPRPAETTLDDVLTLLNGDISDRVHTIKHFEHSTMGRIAKIELPLLKSIREKLEDGKAAGMAKLVSMFAPIWKD